MARVFPLPRISMFAKVSAGKKTEDRGFCIFNFEFRNSDPTPHALCLFVIDDMQLDPSLATPVVPSGAEQ